MAKLNKEEVVTLQVLYDKGSSQAAIAEVLGVTEGTVRYHLRRRAVGREDGRKKRRQAEQFRPAIEWWVEQRCPAAKPGADGTAEKVITSESIQVAELYAWLVEEHGYSHSYQSVLRYVRERYPRARLKPYRRVETPPGAQAQVDWGEFVIDIGDGPQKLYAFIMTLSHSRKAAVVWSRRMDQLAWHHCHNEALRRLGGVPAVLRIDNLKTGIAHGAGPWGEVNESYRAYARSVGFHVDACQPRSPEHKGKVERRVEVLRSLDLTRTPHESLADLQRATDEKLERMSERRRCPATGKSIAESHVAELAALRPLPLLPEVFDVAVTRTVHRDCTVAFEDRTYSVPFQLCGLQVEVRGCVEVVQFLHDGRVWAEHRRRTEERVVLDPTHYEGAGTSRVAPPTPLGRMGRRLQEIALAPVEQRPVDLYAALAEVAR